MLIEAPTQKKTFKAFSSSSEFLIKRGWAAVHSTLQNYPHQFAAHYIEGNIINTKDLVLFS